MNGEGGVMARAHFKVIMNASLEDNLGLLIGRRHSGKGLYTYEILAYDLDDVDNTIPCFKHTTFGKVLKVFLNSCVNGDASFNINNVLEGAPEPLLKGSCYE